MEVVKLNVVGECGSGKSALTVQFIENHFVADYDPTIEDSYRKQVTIDNETFILEVLDTVNHEEFSMMQEYYCRLGQIFMLVYTVSSRATFERIPFYRD